jgi:hypothetical protein
MLNGDYDTVGVEVMSDGLVPWIDGPRPHGRGASDMKGGLAALMLGAPTWRGWTSLGTSSSPVSPTRSSLGLTGAVASAG